MTIRSETTLMFRVYMKNVRVITKEQEVSIDTVVVASFRMNK
jgi:hypothetical protein